MGAGETGHKLVFLLQAVTLDPSSRFRRLQKFVYALEAAAFRVRPQIAATTSVVCTFLPSNLLVGVWEQTPLRGAGSGPGGAGFAVWEPRA